MLLQQLLLEGIDGDIGSTLRTDDFRAIVTEQPVEHWHGDEDAVAIAGETLGFDDRQRSGAGETFR
jgi:hypothetical protein